MKAAMVICFGLVILLFYGAAEISIARAGGIEAQPLKRQPGIWEIQYGGYQAYRIEVTEKFSVTEEPSLTGHSVTYLHPVTGMPVTIIAPYIKVERKR